MNIKKLAQQVQEMRALQKEYFTTRSKSVLGDSKARERELDLLVAKILADPTAGSPSPSDFGPIKVGDTVRTGDGEHTGTVLEIESYTGQGNKLIVHLHPPHSGQLKLAIELWQKV
jgi:hypothetical protein